MKENCSKDELCSAIEELLKEKPKEIDKKTIRTRYKNSENEEEVIITEIGDDD